MTGEQAAAPGASPHGTKADEQVAAPGAPPPGAKVECGKDSFSRFVRRTEHAISGVRVSVDRCPDATLGRSLKCGGVLGVVAGGAAFCLSRSPVVVIGVAVAAAALGALSARYHLAADWDPDRALGETQYR